MNPQVRSGDKTDKAYWDATWQADSLPPSFDPHGPALSNHVNRAYDRFLRTWLGPQGNGRELVELGCARSIWLPYFAKAMNYSVTGVDYSELGCAQARRMLERAGVSGKVHCADFFEPPPSLIGAFDVAVSFGVAEHFEDTASCIAAFARFLKPSGMLLTVVPNMTGLPGLVQRTMNREVFEKHVPLDASGLREAHAKAGLSVEAGGYLVSTNFGAINLGAPGRGATWLAKRVALAGLRRTSLLGWYLEEHLSKLPTVRLTAAYVYCVARLRGAGAQG
ncbi:MAG: class I SAM-dependent methyltransferase [Myxococcota bacterium]